MDHDSGVITRPPWEISGDRVSDNVIDQYATSVSTQKVH
jgi:hypothetical protein